MLTLKYGKRSIVSSLLSLVLLFTLAYVFTPPAFAEGADAFLLNPVSGELVPSDPVPTDIPTVAPGLHYIGGRLVFGDKDGVPAESIGVDTSFYNGMPDWEELKEIGVDFAYIRVGGRGWGNGALYTDEWFLNSIRNAQAAGIKTGVYFYSMAANRGEAKREALYVIEKLDGLPLNLPVYFDMEFSGDYPEGRTDGLTNAQRVDFALEFCRTIEHSDYSAGIYASESFFHDELNMDALSDYPFWVASYNDTYTRPISGDYTIWQFTDSAFLPGISGYCDVNVMYPLPEK